MSFSRELLLQILCTVLAIIVLITVLFGCRCNVEKFADTKTQKEPSPSQNNASLTKNEADMFENLVSDKYSDEEVQNLISQGKLTEDLLDKFIKHLDKSRHSPSSSTQPSTPSNPITPNKVDGFCGDTMYATL